MDEALAGIASATARPSGKGFANLPDHGDLLAYPGKVVRQDGAYTLYRADLSEEHALRAIASGRLRVVTPEGEILDFQYDRHVEHPSGDWTWIGHRPGHEGEQTILTFGAEAAFGSIAQAGKPPLRLTVRDGASWLVETDPAKVAGIANAATRPQRPDYHIVAESELPRRAASVVAVADGVTTSPPVSASTAMVAAAAAATTVDLIIGYTSGFANANGGASGATTRLNYLVDVANAAYANSKVSAQVRLVMAMQVSYTDTNSNDTALEQLSGYKSGSGPVTPDAAFDALRAAREQYGADLVSLVRDFYEPEHGGCGIAWLLGGGLQGIDLNEGWDELGYSVVSDGADTGADGKSYFCLDKTLAHELGHNMGQAHDRETAKGTDGVLDNPDDYGVSDYSFGYKKNGSPSGLYDIMAYGDTGQTSYNIFSNPRVTFCGGQPCGIAAGQANAADASLSLGQTMPVVAMFRPAANTASRKVRDDFNGDGKSDLLWRNFSTGANTIWLSANGGTQQAVAQIVVAWKIVGIGDFNGDGFSDILWRNTSTGANMIWMFGNSSTALVLTTVASQAWNVVGVGDFNGDGFSDILWRNTSTGANTIWRSGNSATGQALTTVTSQAWAIVGVGDFDGDQKSDVVWRNNSTGVNTIWRSANSGTQSTPGAVGDVNWKIVEVADFNGDGKDDFLWRHATTGVNSIWRSGSNTTPQVVSTVSVVAWKIEAAGDYDSDGKADIMWRNVSTGENAIWLAANSSTQRSVATASDLHWEIKP
jgi:hypothetical protein